MYLLQSSGCLIATVFDVKHEAQSTTRKDRDMMVAQHLHVSSNPCPATSKNQAISPLHGIRRQKGMIEFSGGSYECMW